MHRFAVLLLLTACSSDVTDDAVDDYQALVTEMRALITDHGAAVAAAATLDDVTALEASYQTDWQGLSARMGDQLEVMDGCDMGDADMGTMDDATAMMSDMDGLVQDHVAAHDTHTEVATCVTEEDTHEADLTGRMDSMMSRGEGWRTSMHCSGGDMGM